MFDPDKWHEIFTTMSANKLRTFLTGFSVAWGIFMLIILLGSGNGLENGVKAEFKGDAENSIWINPGVTSLAYKGLKPGRPVQFTNEDYNDLSSTEHMEHISSRLYIWENTTISYKSEYSTYDIFACHSDYGYLEKLEVLKGRFLNFIDFKQYRKSVVISEVVERALNTLRFPGYLLKWWVFLRTQAATGT
jgi:putative ABC transport system permease protein